MNEPIRIGTARYSKAKLVLFCLGFVTFVTLYDIQPLLLSSAESSE